MHSETEVGSAVFGDVLDDDVHFNIRVGHSAQNLVGNAWGVRHAQYRNFGLIAVKSDTRYDGLFHLFVFLKSYQRARLGLFVNVDVPRRKAGQHPQLDFVLTRKFDRTNLQHFATH